MIIHRAFIREVLQTCAGVATILVSIFFVIRLVGFLDQAAEGIIAMDRVFVLLSLKMITYLDLIVPLVIYISILLVMGRWIRDNELTVISACGMGMATFIRPVIVLFMIVGSVVGALSFYLSPLSAEAGHVIEFNYKNRSDITGIIPGVFTETNHGNGIYFVESHDTEIGTFRNIFIYTAGENQDDVVVAETGYKTIDDQTNADFLVLTDGSRYSAAAGDSQYTALDFESYAIRLKPRPSANNIGLPVKARPTTTLLEQSGRWREAAGELHWRISKIAMLPVLMIFALCFSSPSYRNKRFPGMITALLVYFSYFNVIGLGIALIRRGVLHPHLSLWVIHLLFLTVAVYFFKRRSRNLRLLPGLRA